MDQEQMRQMIIIDQLKREGFLSTAKALECFLEAEAALAQIEKKKAA